MQEILIDIVKIGFVISVILSLVPLLIWWERKGAAYIQDRRGPNRAAILGVRLGGFVHNIADAIKLFFKEDIIPKKSHKVIYLLAPIVSLFVVISISAIIPFAAPIKIGNYVLKFQVADINPGILYILAISSLGVYSVLLAGWSSGNNYSLFGGLRASAQMISYEVAMGLSLIGVLIASGTLRLDEIISVQGQNPLEWNIVKQPLSMLIFLIALFAETNRNPFDLPEGESELVAGYHTEYSSMKFAMFFMGEYAHIVVGSMIFVTVFLGGWQIPFVSTEFFRKYFYDFLNLILPFASAFCIGLGSYLLHRAKKFGWGDLRDLEPAYFGVPLIFLGTAFAGILLGNIVALIPFKYGPYIVAVCQMMSFLFKVLLCCMLFIWVRWTLPRFRYDQLMSLGWKIMIPLALINIVVTCYLYAV